MRQSGGDAGEERTLEREIGEPIAAASVAAVSASGGGDYGVRRGREFLCGGWLCRQLRRRPASLVLSSKEEKRRSPGQHGGRARPRGDSRKRRRSLLSARRRGREEPDSRAGDDLDGERRCWQRPGSRLTVAGLAETAVRARRNREEGENFPRTKRKRKIRRRLRWRLVAGVALD
ncbi:hypothetical protein LR48_Vigan05g077000 [Vigna angularis]|uniref:Uncharacterized protein n=1 Tax=Phaseolus angularis TaxID=3914 RepID=A0A0L9UKE9_PHAAN|nr:hypothetical protein LR48_Vigan05g077000 [Vigna angularis]